MRSILSHIAVTSGHLRPKSIGEVFALQLARQLDDVDSWQKYVRLSERYSQDLLLRAFKHSFKLQGTKATLADRFQTQLEVIKQKQSK